MPIGQSIRRFVPNISRRRQQSTHENEDLDSTLPDHFVKTYPPTLSRLGKSLCVDVEEEAEAEPVADQKQTPFPSHIEDPARSKVRRNFTQTWVASSDFRKAPPPPPLSSPTQTLEPEELGKKKASTRRHGVKPDRPSAPQWPALERLQQLRAKGGKMPKEFQESFDENLENADYDSQSQRGDQDDDIVDIDRAAIDDFDKAIDDGIAGDAEDLAKDQRNGTMGDSATITDGQSSNSKNIAYRWYHNEHARNSLMSAASAFYCLCATIFSLVFELGYLLSEDKQKKRQLKDQALGIYMYTLGIAFFLYCYVFLLMDPHWILHAKKRVRLLFHRKNHVSTSSLVTLDDGASTTAATIQRHVSHDMPSAGSLYLRLGCVTFGLLGVVYYSLNTITCIADNQCENWTSVVDILGVFFVFIQMHFIFVNSKMSIHGSYTIARFGTMHLVAANLWSWIRYIFIEESHMTEHLKHIFHNNSGHEKSSHNDGAAHDVGKKVKNGAKNLITTTLAAITGASVDHGHHLRVARAAEASHSGDGCGEVYTTECILGGVSEIMFTAIVEYSLIGVAVMFIVWHNIGRAREGRAYIKRKHQIRVDCSKTTSGLFCGFAFLAATFTAMAIFYGFNISAKHEEAAKIYAITDIAQYLIAGFACVYAMFRMRILHYHHHSPSDHNYNASAHSQELLDQMLLAIGLTGEMIQSVAGLVGIFGAFKTQGNASTLLFLLMAVHIISIVQVVIQSCLIFVASTLRIGGDPILREIQPGKHTITFLLIANITMFMMNLLVANRAVTNHAVVNFYGKRSWVFLVRSFTPLVVFYRFHSSVCFVEIWKNTYAWKTASHE